MGRLFWLAYYFFIVQWNLEWNEIRINYNKRNTGTETGKKKYKNTPDKGEER